jgi:predicted DNA binding protein
MKNLTKHSLGFYKNLIDKGFLLEPINLYTGKDDYSYPQGRREPVSILKPTTKDIAEQHYLRKSFVSMCIITGFNDLEVIDLDGKIIKSKEERDTFYKEYFELLENHIEDFYSKFCISKSQNNGYHILYKSKSLVKTTGIAKPKGYKNQLIETRGIGGLIHIYNRVKGLEYHEIDYITDEDRKMLWDISKTYHYEEPIKPKVKKQKTIVKDGLTPWEDYAQKNEVLHVCGDDFDVVKNGRTSALIKRKGAESAFSGHIYDNSGKMFLFSTGTIYPAEKPLNSFDVYVYKYFGGDYSEASKQAYADGYGDRYVKKIDPVDIDPNNKKQTPDDFPLEIFPDFFKNYILECNSKLNASVDFMGSSLIWLTSTMVGNTFKVKVKNGWVDSPIVWISVIGNAGVGKTPDIKLILKPLLELNSQEIKRFAKKNKEFNDYEALTKEEKKTTAKIKEPVKSQMIVDDITIESLVQIHSNNPNSVGVFKDELAGWFKDMNKYRDGSDKERFLSAWSGDSIVLNRKTVEDAFVENPFIPILGGIQPAIFREFQTTENHSNGFMDRMLFCDPNKKAELPTDNEIDEQILVDYNDTIFRIKKMIDSSFTNITNGVVEPFILPLSPEAKKEFNKAHCDLVNLQNSDNEIHYYRGMYAKHITYIPRFALLIEFINSVIDDVQPSEVTIESIQKAVKLSNYFIKMAKINKSENVIGFKMKELVDSLKGKPTRDKVIEISKVFPKETAKQIAEILEITPKTVYKYLKENKK